MSNPRMRQRYCGKIKLSLIDRQLYNEYRTIGLYEKSIDCSVIVKIPSFKQLINFKFALRDTDYFKLLYEWRLEGEPEELRPCLNKLDPSKPISFNNIKIVQFKDNKDTAIEKFYTRGAKDARRGIAIELTFPDGEVKRYPSINEAILSEYCRKRVGRNRIDYLVRAKRQGRTIRSKPTDPIVRIIDE